MEQCNNIPLIWQDLTQCSKCGNYFKHKCLFYEPLRYINISTTTNTNTNTICNSSTSTTNFNTYWQRAPVYIPVYYNFSEAGVSLICQRCIYERI